MKHIGWFSWRRKSLWLEQLWSLRGCDWSELLRSLLMVTQKAGAACDPDTLSSCCQGSLTNPWNVQQEVATEPGSVPGLVVGSLLYRLWTNQRQRMLPGQGVQLVKGQGQRKEQHWSTTTQIWETSECRQNVSKHVGWLESKQMMQGGSVSLVSMTTLPCTNPLTPHLFQSVLMRVSHILVVCKWSI